MQVVILCGGQGTRLREETVFRPKPMVSIGGRPILWHIMKYFSTFGHTEFILTLGYKGEVIKDYFWNYELMNNDVTLELGSPRKTAIHHGHGETGWKVTLADTGLNTLKGGRVKRIQKYVTDDTFILTYGDGLCDVDLEALVAFHHSHGKIATVTGVTTHSRFGELALTGEHQVASFLEKPRPGSRFVNGGFFVFNRALFDHLTPDESCELESTPLEELARAGELMMFRHDGDWACMDTDRDRVQLNKMWDAGRAFWSRWLNRS